MSAQAKAKLWTKDFTLGTAVNFLLMVNYYGLMVVVADFAMKTYGAPPSVAGLAASIFIIGALVARFLAGGLMDRIGRKRLLVAGAVFEVAFSVLYLANLGIAALFALRLAHGIAYGACSTTIGTIVTALVPDSRKGEGVGYYMLSVTLGAAVGPFLGMFLTHNAGFFVLFTVAAGVAALGLLAAAALRVPKPAAPRATVDAKARGIARAERDERAGGFRVPRPRLGSYLERSVIPIGIVCALLFFCYSSLLTFLTPFAAERGLEAPASVFFVVYAIATFVTRPFTGKLFDRKGDRVVMIPAFVAFICGMALLATVHRPPAMLISAALLGFGVGTVQASGLALAVRIAPDDRLSLANSTFYILLDTGVGVGPLLLGLVQPLWGYAGLFTAMAGVAAVALAAYLFVSRRRGAMRRQLAEAERR
ncbi:MFS transporter [Arabiibacter massiliensis]|uniref:MFS transporter n=1 Tax=Arabiibacter massiliensis TaxID=1870985 RepID=UPI0009B9D7B6|nr:MFS transporter [Arabiibacter massiliensis]